MKKLGIIATVFALATLACNAPTMGGFDLGSKAVSPIVANGALSVQGNKIVNQSGQAVQFKGMSFFWSQWSGTFWNAQAVGQLADNWGATIVRAAMGVEMGGYLTNPAAEKARVITVVDAAIAKGLYVIIDWHDHNAITNKVQAKAFFTEMAQKYGKNPQVLFEVFNEPDGEQWPEIKAYAEEIIGAIRGTGSNNIVIVGTPTWSQDVDQAANNPITAFSNVAYTLHYYAATHKQSLRDKAAFALSKGIALMVTEFGTCEATGDGLVDKVESQKWFDFLDQNKISWMNWSLFDKQEAASSFKPGTSPTGPWTDANLTESGLFVFNAMKAGTTPNPTPTPTPTPPTTGGFKIANGKLVDANGNVFIMQGVNHAHTWFKDKISSVIPQIKDKKANTVRVVLSNGTRWSKDDTNSVKNIISIAKANKLISILEVHDTTGFGEDGAATNLDRAADYWVELKPILAGEEKYVILNIGNEPYGNTNTGGWTQDTINALKKMRAAGLQHTIMVDAPNWGQDWSNTMKSQASSIFNSDPNKNVVFSIHMYAVYNDATKVQDYISAFANAKLPLVVGEFGNAHNGSFVAASDIMRISKAQVNGYLGWSWSGNGGSDAPLDLVIGWNPSSPSSWGNMLFADLQSSTQCSVFNTQGNLPPSVSITSPAQASTVNTNTSVTVQANASDADGSVASVDFFVNGSLIATDTSAPYSASFTTGASAGQSTIKAVAKDNAGASSESSVTITVQAPQPTAPTVQITSPVNNANIVPGALATIQANASDSDGTVVSVAFYQGTTLLGTDTTAPFSASWTAPSLEGTYAIKAVATDNAGLKGESNVSVLVKKEVVPTVKITYTKNDWGSGFTATVKISNPGTTAINNWKLTFTFAGNQKITDNWSASWTQVGNAVTALPLSWNSSIAPNSTIEIGFNANYSGSNIDPSDFKLTY